MPNVSDSDEILSRLFGSVSRARILEFLVSQAGRAFYQRKIMYETGLSLSVFGVKSLFITFEQWETEGKKGMMEWWKDGVME